MRKRGEIYDDTPLLTKEAIFCSEYLIDGNGTRSALAAGCTENSAANMAIRWLKQPNVAARLVRSVELKTKRNEVNADYVLVTIKETIEKAIAAGDLKNVYKGCELLGKHLKLFTDVQEHRFTVTEMGKVEIIDNDSGDLEAISFDIGADANPIDTGKL